MTYTRPRRIARAVARACRSLPLMRTRRVGAPAAADPQPLQVGRDGGQPALQRRAAARSGRARVHEIQCAGRRHQARRSPEDARGTQSRRRREPAKAQAAETEARSARAQRSADAGRRIRPRTTQRASAAHPDCWSRISSSARISLQSQEKALAELLGHAAELEQRRQGSVPPTGQQHRAARKQVEDQRNYIARKETERADASATIRRRARALPRSEAKLARTS